MKKILSGVLAILSVFCTVVFTVSAGGGENAAAEVQRSTGDTESEQVQKTFCDSSGSSEVSANLPEKVLADPYEELAVPDFEELGVTCVRNTEACYNVDAYKGKIYVSGAGLQVRVDGKDAPVILVYDENSGKWGTIQATFLDVEEELQSVIGDGKLYLFSNSGYKLNIFVYDLETKEVKKLSSVESHKYEIKRSLIYNDGQIWMIGGSYLDSEGKQLVADSEIRRINISNGKVEKTNTKLKCARAGALAELIDGKIIVTGGKNADGEWETTTEVIDCAEEMVTSAENLEDTVICNLEKAQWAGLLEKNADVEILISGGCVSGDFFYVYGVTNDKSVMFRRIKVK